MPAAPRRYLIDVPGGEEEGAGWGWTFDINTILNVMDRTIRTGKVYPYNDLIKLLRQRDPEHGGGMGYLKYGMQPSVVLVWMYRSMDLTVPRLQGKFMQIPEEMFSEPYQTHAREWLASHINSSIVGPGAFGRLGFLVDVNDLSDFILDPFNYALGTMRARGGVVAIINRNLKVAKYTIVPASDRHFLPVWGESLDIGNNSVGALSRSREWFWKVEPLTSGEKAMIDEMFEG